MYLYNSLTRTKDEFKTITPNKVLLYVCGITPYDTTHLGHAFTYMTFDILVRLLRYKGYDVTYTQNVTDIDDDILKKAKEENRDWRELGNTWTKRFLSDLKALNIAFPTHYVKATDSIEKMQQMITKLLRNRHAYENGGNIYFSIKSFPDYGKLSRLNNEEMLVIAKERGGNPDDALRKDPLDFLLWQHELPGEPSWNSPWPIRQTQGKGKGRPGWHIECSAMIHQYLGNRIDIHGGGFDLIFPHHESEIAQSESFTGKKPFVRTWMHTQMARFEGEKMSKSLGNLVMISELLQKYDANAIRWMLLSHHYRSSFEFEMSEMLHATAAINHIKPLLVQETEMKENQYINDALQFLENDLDTPRALSYITSLCLEATQEKNQEKRFIMQQNLTASLSLLGFSFE